MRAVSSRRSRRLVGLLLAVAAAQPAAALAPGGQRVAASERPCRLGPRSPTDFDVRPRSADGGDLGVYQPAARRQRRRRPASRRGRRRLCRLTGRTATGPQIFLAASHDRGVVRWRGASRLSPPCPTSRRRHVGPCRWFADGVAAAADLFVRSSADGGAAFGPPVNVSASAELTDSPALAADGSRSTQSGGTAAPGTAPLPPQHRWGRRSPRPERKCRARPAAGRHRRQPSAWPDGVCRRERHRRLPSRERRRGASFAPHEPERERLCPSTCSSPSRSRVFVAWRDFELGRSETYFRASGDAGATFA